MARFYNPYHFVPVEKPNAAQQHLSIAREAFREGRPEHITHERYVPKTHSGRLVVGLTTVTATVIGAEQTRRHENACATVAPYQVEGRPAIAASTLRGLVGSVIEAASNGPLRVLENRAYSYRRGMNESLSAIGLIVMEGETPKLKPMCLPTLVSDDGGRTFLAEARFRRIFPKPQLKVFFGTREPNDPDNIFIFSDRFPYRTARTTAEAVPMPVRQLAWAGNAVRADDSLKVNNRFALAQVPLPGDPERKGLVRVLGCWGDRAQQMPRGKKHELWIPLPDGSGKSLPIAAEGLERFYQLADERTERDPSLPFEPKDTRPDAEDRGDGRCFRLRDGDMVYFDVDDAGTVVEISLSAIWRGRVEESGSRRGITTYSFFHPELLPFNRERRTIAVAEQMLGFAEELERPGSSGQTAPDQPAAEDLPGGLALASRIRFEDAILRDGAPAVFDPPVILGILDSPKLPCPALYFKASSGRGAYIKKRQINPADHLPQGRKWYLHAKPPSATQPWATLRPDRNLKQKNRVTPISAGQQFFFHIDFDNLTEEELGLLLYALEPDTRFHHKLGMGKPLGLGSVKIGVLGYFRVDRERRYTIEGLRDSRYSDATFTQEGMALRDQELWPTRYQIELRAQPGNADAISTARGAVLRTGLIPNAIEKCLSLLGDFDAAPSSAEVHYPTNVDQTDKEAEHFKWFQFNDGHREHGHGMSPSGQFLRPLAFERSLPPLTELE